MFACTPSLLGRSTPLALMATLAIACGGSPGAAASPADGQAPGAAGANENASTAAAEDEADADAQDAAKKLAADPPSEKPEASGTAPAKAKPASAPPPPLPKGTVVLHIGDSMAAALEYELREQFKEHGIKVINNTKEGTHLPLWGGKFSKVPSLVKQHKPDLVIVNLGGNDAMIKDPSDRVESITRLVTHLQGTPCVWVAPSLWDGENGVLGMIKEHSKPCRYFDTNTITPNLPRASNDKIHPSLDGRRVWAKAIIDWLQQERDPSGATPFALKPGD